MSKMEVGFQLELDTTVSEFQEKIEEFKKAMAEIIWGTGNHDLALITITSIVSGSVVVDGSVQVESEEEEDQVFNTLVQDLSTNSQIMGYNVMSAQYTKTTEEEDKVVPEREEEGSNIAAIAGGAAGGLVGTYIK